MSIFAIVRVKEIDIFCRKWYGLQSTRMAYGCPGIIL